MTDLITLIKNAIERAQQRDRSGRIDAQSMAESVALAIEFAGWKSPDEVKAELDERSLPPPPEKD